MLAQFSSGDLWESVHIQNQEQTGAITLIPIGKFDWY